jgi:hypothetical protein
VSACSRERFPGPTSRGTARQITSDPGRAHLMSWHRTNASGAYSVWMARVVTRYSGTNGHFPLCNVCPVCGTPFPRPRTRKSVSLSWYLPGTCHTGVSAALGARACSQTPAGVHQAFQNASTDHRIQHLIGTQPDWEQRSGLGLLVRGSTSKSRGWAPPSSPHHDPSTTLWQRVSPEQPKTMEC